jgi:hypothetical protein
LNPNLEPLPTTGADGLEEFMGTHMSLEVPIVPYLTCEFRKPLGEECLELKDI